MALLAVLILSVSLLEAQGQQANVTGQVTGENGESIPGVNILVKGTAQGTSTDIEGKYRLNLPQGKNVLVFSFLGYKSQELMVDGKTVLDVQLLPNLNTMDEVVVVGYGTERKQSVTGAISQVDGEDLLKAPMGNVTNLLGGRVPGVISLQQSGQPGADASSLLVRGSSAKYIVDGVPRSFSEIDPNTIETISVLKDAAAASVYGLDANAVIIITTKRGKKGESRISFTGNHGVSSNAVMLEMLDGPGYAYWYNKAREMDDDEPIFSSEHVEKMLNGDPTDGWGNTNWYKKTFGFGKTRNYNVNATGGTDKIRYFVSLGNFNQDGNVDGFTYNRLNLRSNIDADIANNLELTFNVAGRIEDRKRPGYSASPGDWNNIPQQAIRAHPYVPEIYDGLPVSTRTSSSYINPLASSSLTGYNKSKVNVIQTNLSLNYNVPFVKGLSAKFMNAYDVSYQMTKSFSTPYYTNVATVPSSTSGDISYSYAPDARGTTAGLAEGLSHYAYWVTNTSLQYETTIKQHHIKGMALMETVQQDGNNFAAYGYGFDIYELDELSFAKLDDRRNISGGSYQQRKAGFLGRLGYDYADKYLTEFSVRYDGSYVFGGMVDGKRWGVFPAASLGWRISEEDWFAPRSNVINNLKLRGSIGLTGTSQIGPYYYLNTMSFLDTPAVVLGGEPQNGLLTSRPANVNLTWAKALQYNGGFDATLWNGLLSMEVDVFYKYIFDILSSVDATYPDSFGGYIYQYENNNEQDHRGFEITLSHEQQLGEFSYKIGVNGTYTKRRWLRYGDSENTPDWLKLTGKEVGAKVGFIAEGLFQNQEEIDNSPLIEGKAVRPGDIRYQDINGDGVISYEQDRGYIGKSSYPKFVGGFTFDASWKQWDIALLMQGALGRDVALTGVYSGGIMDHTSMTRPFYHGGNSPAYLLENSWREDNPSGEFPRLSVVPASSNNAFSSTFWYRNGDYLRVKSFQIGYSFPSKWMQSIGVNALRLYAEGQNLFTWSKLTKYHIDPEQPGVSNGYYPQQRVISAGLKLTF